MTVAHIRERSQDLAWKAEARCAGVDPELFFSEKSESLDDARAVCALCPVQPECLEYALAGAEKHGLWGGKSERQRRTLRAARFRAQRKEAS